MAKYTILFVAVHPVETGRLALDEEAREVRVALERSDHRDQFELKTRWCVRPLDLCRALREVRPAVLHFHGHADPEGRLPVASTTALTEALGTAGCSTKLLMLNTCRSACQAEALLAHVPCVVGMHGAMRDEAAREFAVAFYGGLGDSAPVSAAFEHGLAVLECRGAAGKPWLKVRTGVDASQLSLATTCPAGAIAARAAANDPARAAVAGPVALRATAPPQRPGVDPDSEVLGLVCKGEPAEALRLLMERHGADVYRFCRRMLRDPTLADDVHQHVFIEAYRDLPRFAGRSSLRTWLFSIARHRALDALRSRARQESRQADLAEIAGVFDPRPLATESLDRRQLLVTGLDSLEAQAREALLLRYEQELSFEEMAQICDQRPAVLRMRVSRAMRQLRAAMKSLTGGLATTGRAEGAPAAASAQSKLETPPTKRSVAAASALAIAAVAMMTVAPLTASRSPSTSPSRSHIASVSE